MKKLLSLLLLSTLLLGLAPATQAASDSLKVDVVKELTFSDPLGEMDAFTLLNQSPHPVNVSIEVFDQAALVNVQTIHVTLNPGDAPLPIKAKVYKSLPRKGSINLYRYTITTQGGFKKQVFVAQKLMDYGAQGLPIYNQYHNVNLRNNTASSFGLQFREVTPGMTDLWYMFTPLDLTRQGRQTYELIASNMYVIGEVYVDVYGDTVTITYHNYYDGQGGETKTRQEFLGLYGSYAEVVLPSDVPVKSYINPPTRFTFGMPFSIQYDLGGDTNVLMLVRNVVDYWRYPLPVDTEFARFWATSPGNKAMRESMLSMMDPIYPTLPGEEGK